MFDDDDYESLTIRYIFKSLQFEYGGFSNKPTSYNYLMCKDMLKWSNLKPKNYIPLINAMFNSFVNGLPNPKSKK